MKRLLASVVAAVAVCGAALADGEWSSRAPLQDTFVRDTQPGANFGTSTGLIAGNNRESCIMFDVSGLANVTAARLKLYVAQIGTKDGVVWPVYARVMRNDRWNENTLTWNLLPDEFRAAQPVLATNDVTLAGYVEIPAGSVNSWCTIDITEAVKAAAPRGRLSLHLYTPWDGNSGDSTPLSFASSDHSDATLRPTLEFQGAVDTSAASLTLLPMDDVFIEASHADVNYGVSNAGNGGARYMSVLAQLNNREGFIKFDLSGIGAAHVDSAVLLLRMNESQDRHTTGNTVQFQLMENTAWNEADVTWNNASSTVGVTPGSAWPEETPANAVRVGSANTNVFYHVELASLVNQVLAAGKTTMSLHIKMQNSEPAYFIFYSKEWPNERWRPRLLVTPKVDAPLTIRTPVQETFVSDYSDSNLNKSFYDGAFTNRVQIGSRDGKVQYATMLFDPSGLENSAFVRFRIISKNSIGADAGALRVTAWTTDRWNETNLTWNTVRPWFPQLASVVEGMALDGEVASVKLTQTKYSGTYFEVDVTAAAHAAATAGRMLTLGLFSNLAWPEFRKGASDAPAGLIFPDPDATFGSYVHAALDRSGETPALKLTWAPGSAAGAAYTVERREDGAWTTVATGLSEATCLDADAKPYETHTYRVTETASGESITKSVDFAPEVKVMACADTFVYSGAKGATNGAATSIVHKYTQNDGGIREGFYRFDLSEVPENFKTATLKFYTTGPDEYYSGNELFWVLVYPDFEWTDANAPSWNDVFGNEWSTPQARGDHPDTQRPLESNVNTVGDVTSRLLGGDVFEYDVASIISAAKAKGDSHITFHTCAYDPECAWNFGIISRERAQGVSQAAQIVFRLKNWVKRGTVLVIR